MNDPPGLRALKKQQTREAIAAAAWRLFETRGFEDVTVAEIARAADVSEKTVFNYFPAKEDLFYRRLEAFESELLAAVRQRLAGETALRAFRRFLLQPRGVFARRAPAEARAARDRLRRLNRTVARSPVLLARERQLFARCTASLAALLAVETAAGEEDVEPWIAAHALMGVHRTLIDLVRRRVLAGDDEPARLAHDLRVETERAFALLDTGLNSYAPAPAGRTEANP